MKDNPITISVAALLAHPNSSKEEAYNLGFDAGRLAGIIEAHQTFDKLFSENYMEKSGVV